MVPHQQRNNNTKKKKKKKKQPLGVVMETTRKLMLHPHYDKYPANLICISTNSEHANCQK